MAIARDFFDAVRSELARQGRAPSPQTRDMNPVYTGKDVSFIDTKQAQRLAETELADAETAGRLCRLPWACPYPMRELDKAWRQLVFNAHHDGITGSESDQVYLDLLGGWREAYELAAQVAAFAPSHLVGHSHPTGTPRAEAEDARGRRQHPGLGPFRPGRGRHARPDRRPGASRWPTAPAAGRAHARAGPARSPGSRPPQLPGAGRARGRLRHLPAAATRATGLGRRLVRVGGACLAPRSPTSTSRSPPTRPGAGA